MLHGHKVCGQKEGSSRGCQRGGMKPHPRGTSFLHAERVDMTLHYPQGQGGPLKHFKIWAHNCILQSHSGEERTEETLTRTLKLFLMELHYKKKPILLRKDSFFFQTFLLMFLPDWAGSKRFSAPPSSREIGGFPPDPPVLPPLPSTPNSEENLMQPNGQLSEPKVERKQGTLWMVVLGCGAKVLQGTQTE